MRRLVSRFIGDESGATALEYALILGLIAVLIIGALTTFGVNLNASFAKDANALR